jgi:hypothetical protein
MIQEKQIRGLKNELVPSKTRIVPKAPPHLFPLHSLMAFIGPRGSGKTNACVLLTKEYLDYQSFNRVIICSPTYESNPQFLELDAQPEDIYTDVNTIVQDMNAIVRSIEEAAEKYEIYLTYCKSYKRYLQGKMNLEDEILLEKNHYEKPPVIPRPSPVLILDDLSHTAIYGPSRDNAFNNLCLRHRHVGGYGYGVSIMMLVQNFKTGIPLFLRQNIQQYFIWPTHDTNLLKSIYLEFANLCSEQCFFEIFHRAIEGEHNFLTVDPNNHDHEARFRRNFDIYLIPTPTFERTKRSHKKRKGGLEETIDSSESPS